MDGGPACGSAALGFDSASVQANPNDLLTARFIVAAHGAQSVAVIYALSVDGGIGTTPSFAAIDGGQSLPVLGLYPQTGYEMQAIAIDGNGGLARSPVQRFTTQALPVPVTSNYTFDVTVNEPSAQPGYIVIDKVQVSAALPQAAVIVDRTGRVAWYAPAEVAAPNGDFQKQPDGTYTISLYTSSDIPVFFPSVFEAVDDLSVPVRTWAVPDPDGGTDNHELRVQSNGEALVFGPSVRTFDMTAYDGGADGVLMGDKVYRLQVDGGIAFQWDFFDDFTPDDIDPLVSHTAPAVDAIHANSVEASLDGNYLISSRHLSQVLKLNSQTGEVMWRLGGHRNQFTFVNDPIGTFSMQHYAREIAPNDILLFDDGDEHVPVVSRAAEYQLDFFPDGGPNTATMVWSYTPPALPDGGASAVSFAMGSAQRLPNGDTLISYGTLPRVDEVDAQGNLVWQMVDSEPSFGFYRALWIDSLY